MRNKIISSIKKLAAKLLSKNDFIASLDDDGRQLYIVDTKWLCGLRPEKREIRMMDTQNPNSVLGFYSIIYKSKKCIFQPFLLHIQKLFWAWNKVRPIKRALVLGCAGCAVPRFFHNGTEADITGIEFSPLMINVAQKYFLDNIDESRFHLVEGDAIKYVNEYNGEAYDAVFVDIFCGADLVRQVMSDEWQKKIHDLLAPNGIVVYNVLNGANTLRKVLLPMFPWTGYMKMGNGKSAVIAMNYTDISTVVRWKKELINEKWLWI